MRRPRARRRVSAGTRIGQPNPNAINEIWSMDFIHDRLADGGKFRVLTLVDIHTRESLDLFAGRSLKGSDVVKVLESVTKKRETSINQSRQWNRIHFSDS